MSYFYIAPSIYGEEFAFMLSYLCFQGNQSQHQGPPPAGLTQGGQLPMTIPITEKEVTSPLPKPNLPVPDISSPERPYKHKGAYIDSKVSSVQFNFYIYLHIGTVNSFF